MTASAQVPEPGVPAPAGAAGVRAGPVRTQTVRAETVRRLEQAMGALGTAAMASMEQRLPWFRALPAENRSWIGLVAQAGIAAFVDWVKHPQRRPAVAGEVFGTAPRELARAVSLQQTVEMVRITIDVVEAQVDELAAPGGEAELREAVLRYTREVAFGAAQVYARTAEARGAWDARLEALVVDSLVRGEAGDGMHSWAAALNWSSSPVAVIAGTADDGESEGIIEDLRAIARRSRLDLLAGVQGSRLVVVLGGSADPFAAAQQLAGRFGPGPVVVGHAVPDLHTAAPSVAAALAGLRAAAGLAGRAAAGAGRRPAAGARPGRRRGGPRRTARRRVRAHAERRRGAGRDGHHLSGAGVLTGGGGAAAVRTSQHCPLPAAPGE